MNDVYLKQLLKNWNEKNVADSSLGYRAFEEIAKRLDTLEMNLGHLVHSNAIRSDESKTKEDMKEFKEFLISDNLKLLDKFPLDIMIELAKVIDFGAQKYEREGWKENNNGYSNYYGKALKHLGASIEKEKDDESGLDHMAHAIVNLIFSYWHLKNSEKNVQ